MNPVRLYCTVKNCQYSTTKRFQLSSHRRRFHRKLRKQCVFKCPLCEKIIIGETKYKAHVQQKHLKPNPATKTNPILMSCPVSKKCCHPYFGERYVKKHALAYHSDNKTTWIWYANRKDNRQTPQPARLKWLTMQSMTMEQIQKEYHLPLITMTCSKCNFKSLCMDVLGDHCLKTHCQTAQTYQCKVTAKCKKTFNYYTRLLYHIKYVHKKNFFPFHANQGKKLETEIFSCNNCKLAFVIHAEFINHTNQTHPELVTSGSICTKCCKKLAVTDVVTEHPINYCPMTVMSHTKIKYVKPKVKTSVAPTQCRTLKIYACSNCDKYKTLVYGRFDEHQKFCESKLLKLL